MLKKVSVLVVLLSLWLCGCGSEPTAEAPAGGTGGAAPTTMTSAPPTSLPTPTGRVTEGGDLNQYFPDDGDGYNVVFTQEKKGAALAELQRNGKRVANLSITDVAANPDAISKYNNSGKQLAGYPASNVGSQGTAILVANKYQVQVRSADPAFTSADREAWLQKFKLSEIK